MPRRSLHRRLVLGALAVLVGPLAAAGQSRFPLGENLLVPIPNSWRLAHASQGAGYQIQEFLPDDAKRDSWTRLLTVQVRRPAGPPASFVGSFVDRLRADCPKVMVDTERLFDVDEYTAARAMLRAPQCRAVPAENSLMEIIRGRDFLYAILLSWRPSPPTPQELVEANAMFDGIRVCDTRANNCADRGRFTDEYHRGHTPPRELWRRSFDTARTAIQESRHAAAERALRDAATEAERLWPSTDELARTYDELAALYATQGRTGEAGKMRALADKARERLK